MKELTGQEKANIAFWLYDLNLSLWPQRRKEVLELVLPRAEEGDAECCRYMGKVYINNCRIGEGGAEEARQWMRKAVEKDSDALFSLGSILEDPDEREQCYLRYLETFDDEKLAFYRISREGLLEWLANRVENNSSYTLDGKPDQAVAVRLWQRAIDGDSESPEAHMYLGKAYLDGLGVEVDQQKAFYHIQYAYEHRGAASTTNSIWEEVPELYARCLRLGLGTDPNGKTAGDVMGQFREDWDYLDDMLSR